MNRPRDPPKPYGQRGIGLDPDRRHTRGGPPHGPRSGPNMTNRRMPDYDEGMDDLVDDFDNMGMDPREHAAPGRPQGRRGPRQMDAFDEEDMDPHRSSVRGGSQDRAGMGRRRMNNMDDVGEDEIGAGRPSTRGTPQGRRGTGMGRRGMDNMDDFGEDEVGAGRPSTRGTPQGRRGIGSEYRDESVTDMFSYVPKSSRTGVSRTGVSRVGAGDSRAGGEHGARLMTDDNSHVPRGIRGPRPSTTNSVTSLRELEDELDRAEETKRQAVQYSQTAKKSFLDVLNKQIKNAVHRSMELKNEIYKIDPKSERVDNTARFFLHLPYNPDLDHGKKGAPQDHQGRASRGGGDRGRRGARLDARDHY